MLTKSKNDVIAAEGDIENILNSVDVGDFGVNELSLRDSRVGYSLPWRQLQGTCSTLPKILPGTRYLI